MDLNGTAADGEWNIHRNMLRSVMRTVWQYQQELIKNPDPDDEWWFLVDPSVEPPHAEVGW